jgi:hypothetical protein
MKTAKKVFGVVAALAIGGFVFISGLKDYRESRHLQAENKTATAKVLDERTSYRSKGRTKYFLTVEFQTDQNQTINKEVLVNHDTQRAGTASKATIVHYLPSNPEIFQAGEKVELRWSNLIIGSIILICGVITVFSFRHTHKPQESLQSQSDLSDQNEEAPRKAA